MTIRKMENKHKNFVFQYQWKSKSVCVYGPASNPAVYPNA